MPSAKYQRIRFGGSGEEVVYMFLRYMGTAAILNFRL